MIALESVLMLYGTLLEGRRRRAASLDEARGIEIMLNPDGRVWVDRAGEGMAVTERSDNCQPL